MKCTVNQFVTFCHNFPYNFIEEAFKSKGKLMVDHLSNKYSEAYDRANSRGAMTTFYSNLDQSNQNLLESYIGNYYSS